MKQSAPLIQFGAIQEKGGQVSVDYETAAGLSEAKFYYTLDTGLWPERKWESIPARFAGKTLLAKIPAATVACYFAASDDRGLMTSSEYLLRSRP